MSAFFASAPVMMQMSGEGGGGLVSFLLPLVVIFAIFYFLIMRPQKKRQQEHESMVEALKKGDKIVTIGGIHGTVTQVDDDSVLAQVDAGSTKLRFDKNAIANVGGKKEK